MGKVNRNLVFIIILLFETSKLIRSDYDDILALVESCNDKIESENKYCYSESVSLARETTRPSDVEGPTLWCCQHNWKILCSRMSAKRVCNDKEFPVWLDYQLKNLRDWPCAQHYNYHDSTNCRIPSLSLWIDRNDSLVKRQSTSSKCPRHWQNVNGRCIQVRNSRVNFVSAVESCGRSGGVLGSVHSEQEAKLIYNCSGSDCPRKLYLGTWVQTNKTEDPYSNLDGSPTDWLSISGKEWAQCLSLRPTKNKSIDSYEHYPLKCRNYADGYVCQKDNSTTTKGWAQCTDKLLNDQTTKACVESATSKWIYHGDDDRKKKACCLMIDVRNCARDNMDRVCDKDEQDAYLRKEVSKENVLLADSCKAIMDDYSKCGIASISIDNTDDTSLNKCSNTRSIAEMIDHLSQIQKQLSQLLKENQ